MTPVRTTDIARSHMLASEKPEVWLFETSICAIESPELAPDDCSSGYFLPASINRRLVVKSESVRAGLVLRSPVERATRNPRCFVPPAFRHDTSIARSARHQCDGIVCESRNRMRCEGRPASQWITVTGADDFPSRKTGPIADIHLWASWLGDIPDQTKLFSYR
jgi:hypothetical protein